MAGLTLMPVWRFLWSDAAGSLLWSGSFLALGFFFRRQLEAIADIALSLAQSAHKEAPNVPPISDTLAWAYYHKGLYKMSITLLEDALKAEPENALYHFHIGLAYGKIDDRSQARFHLRKALAIEPNSAQADLARKQLQDLGS